MGARYNRSEAGILMGKLVFNESVIVIYGGGDDS